MNPRIVIVVYRPLPGKEAALQSVVAKHLGVLKKENLVTDRASIVMKAQDASIVEVFEWRSAEAIAAAHTNPKVLELWDEFAAVCEYEKPVNVPEFHNLFSEFEPLQF
jgi:hypothetical protein